MPLPKKCKMPKINIDHKAVSRYWGARIVGADIGFKPEMYRAVFIRLTDKALYEYNMARNAVLAQIEGRDINHPLTTFIGEAPFYQVVIANHLETCINATNRALDILKRVIHHSRIPFFINRVHRKNVERYFDSINDIRNTLEHIDDEISENKFKKDQPVFLTINEDASEARIGGEKIDLISLARVISKLHKFALELALFDSPGLENEKFEYVFPKQKKNNKKR